MNSVRVGSRIRNESLCPHFQLGFVGAVSEIRAALCVDCEWKYRCSLGLGLEQSLAR